MMTPNNIDVLLHCHTTAGPHPRIEAGAVKEALAWMHRELVIKVDPEDYGTEHHGYRTTEKGAAWVRALCSVPCPAAAWIDEHGNVL